jgi:hypothetical protein
VYPLAGRDPSSCLDRIGDDRLSLAYQALGLVDPALIFGEITSSQGSVGSRKRIRRLV